MVERSTEERSPSLVQEMGIFGFGFIISFFQMVVVPEWYWIGWLLLGFAIPEAIALFNKAEGDTLSEHVRKWFATDILGRQDLTAWAKIRRVLLVIGLAWLVMHWLTNGLYV